MTRLILLVAIFLCQILLAQKNLTELTKKYNPYVSELNHGIGILIQKNGKTEVVGVGKGNFSSHTVFNIGSATKKMTAILLLQEEEKGSLKLSDSIGKYLQPIKNVDMSLTIETLLRHRSGLGEFVGKEFKDNYFAKNDSIYNQDFLKSIPKNNPKKIGKFDYCNTNYLLLGKILEKITDKSYFDLLRERIFLPADMTESYPYVSKNLKNLALPTEKGKEISKFLDYRFFANYAFSAGCVASTLHDMAKFYRQLFENKIYINQTSLNKLIAFDAADYGLGTMKLSDGYIGHGGNNIGYSFREYYNPNTKNMVLIFANSYFISFGKMLKQEIFDYMNDKDSKVIFRDNVFKNFKNVAGKYHLELKEMKMEMEIVIRNNYLYLSVPMQDGEVILVSKEKNKLYNGGFGVELEVIPNNNDELIFRQNGLETNIKRIN